MPIAPTKLSFYQDMEKRKFSAKVIYCEKSKVAFDMTLFYPEGGGQLGDVGSIQWNGIKSKVIDVQKIGDVVLHQIEGQVPSEGTEIVGLVDDDRRSSKQTSCSHSLIGAACRKYEALMYGKRERQSQQIEPD